VGDKHARKYRAGQGGRLGFSKKNSGKKRQDAQGHNKERQVRSKKRGTRTAEENRAEESGEKEGSLGFRQTRKTGSWALWGNEEICDTNQKGGSSKWSSRGLFYYSLKKRNEVIKGPKKLFLKEKPKMKETKGDRMTNRKGDGYCFLGLPGASSRTSGNVEEKKRSELESPNSRKGERDSREGTTRTSGKENCERRWKKSEKRIAQKRISRKEI